MILELSSLEIGSTLALAGIRRDCIFLADEDYALASARWVTGPFAREFAGILHHLKIRYVPERQDCDNFAQLAAWFAQHFHAETKSAPEAGLAFGELWVSSLQHAVNIALHRDGAALRVAVYEPQPDARGFCLRPLKITLDDLRSVTLCKL